VIIQKLGKGGRLRKTGRGKHSKKSGEKKGKNFGNGLESFGIFWGKERRGVRGKHEWSKREGEWRVG
jgi:hypothetical protein